MDKVLAATRGIKIVRTPQLTSGVQVKVGRLPKQVWKSICLTHAHPTISCISGWRSNFTPNISTRKTKFPLITKRVTQDHNNTARREVTSDKTHRALQLPAILSSEKLKHSGTALMVGKW
jgi:hypothetical protein